ncbi:hypothetical protein BKA93DRAFT_830393 [Sparassis latifolia]
MHIAPHPDSLLRIDSPSPMQTALPSSTIESQGWYVILGGQRPGIVDTPPIMSGGKFSPALPVLVKCHTQAQAEDVERFNDVVKPLKHLDETTTEAIVDLINQSSVTPTILRAHQNFWCVVYGNRSGIFMSNTEAIAQVNGMTKAIFRRISEQNGSAFKRALIYMVMKGASEKDLSEQRADSSSIDPQLNSLSTSFQTQFTMRVEHSEDVSHAQPSTPSACSQARQGAIVSNASIRAHSPSRQPTPVQHGTPSRSSRQGSAQHSDDSQDHEYAAAASGPPSVYIYQHVRNLAGIVKTLLGPCTDSTPALSLGHQADAYLQAHGYSNDANMTLCHAYSLSGTLEEFIEKLAPKGMPIKEIKYLWCLCGPSDRVWAEVEIQ